jgi:hypothetical protein
MTCGKAKILEMYRLPVYFSETFPQNKIAYAVHIKMRRVKWRVIVTNISAAED